MPTQQVVRGGLGPGAVDRGVTCSGGSGLCGEYGRILNFSYKHWEPWSLFTGACGVEGSPPAETPSEIPVIC